MNAPPLAIVQARLGSTRLPNKMLLPLAGKPLWWHAWHAAVEAFGHDSVVVAMPASAENDPLAESCEHYGATVFRWDGPEEDVLGRFHACAHRYRWHPDSVIVRITPDDPRKDVLALRKVAAGHRLCVERGGEAFTLAMLDRRMIDIPRRAYRYGELVPNTIRQHISCALFPEADPPHPPDDGTPWTVDTQEDYERMKAFMERRAAA